MPNNHPPIPPGDERFVEIDGKWYFRLPDDTLVEIDTASPAWRRIIAAVAAEAWDQKADAAFMESVPHEWGGIVAIIESWRDWSRQ